MSWDLQVSHSSYYLIDLHKLSHEDIEKSINNVKAALENVREKLHFYKLLEESFCSPSKITDLKPTVLISKIHEIQDIACLIDKIKNAFMTVIQGFEEELESTITPVKVTIQELEALSYQLKFEYGSIAYSAYEELLSVKGILHL